MVGETDSLKGEIDSIPYGIFCMKEPDYVMKIMATYGELTAKDGQKESIRKYTSGGEQVGKNQYTLPFSNHFDYWHRVDDHNNLCHSLPSIESTWVTHRWATRIFSFIFAMVQINCYLAFKFFVWRGQERQTLGQFGQT